MYHGNRASMNRVKKFAVCVDNVRGYTAGHVPRNNLSNSCSMAGLHYGHNVKLLVADNVATLMILLVIFCKQ